MPFQRSYSKVWWGSESQLPAMSNAAGSVFLNGGFYSNLIQQQQHLSQQQQQQQQQQPLGRYSGYHTLDFSQMKSYAGNLSRILEVDDEQNMSKLSWEKQNSPGSLRSQDSGFSDNEESHSSRSLSVRSSKTASPGAKSNLSAQSTDSPISNRSIATPPTVVRRVGRSEFFAPLVSVSRRISFSGSPSPNAAATKKAAQEASIECAELDGMQPLSSPPKKSHDDTKDSDPAKGNEQRRRRRVVRKVTKPLTPTKRRTLGSTFAESDDSDDELRTAENSNLDVTDASASRTVPEYNNETVYLGGQPQPNNNETFVISRTDTDALLGDDDDTDVSPFKQYNGYTASTSTPNANSQHPAELPSYGSTLPQSFYTPHVYENPLLNGHSPALQSWLDDLRLSYDHEVMSTLQAKSISQEAFKNLTITTNTVTKLIRQLQQRALSMQSEFECIERMLTGAQSATLQEALSGGAQLLANAADFIQVLERRAIFFAESRVDRKKFNDHIEHLKIIVKDTRYSLERQHYINLQSLLDDVHVLKRFLLIAVRLVFEKMVRVIVQSIEHSNCDLMLRANINMIATLTNIDYEGFASLTDAFVQNEAVRTLLIVCLDHKLSSVRAMALRALSTICCSPEAIAQLGACGGIEVVRDVLLRVVKLGKQVGELKRGELEQREAVSLLTQITAPWHGSGHRVDGLKDCVESLVEGLTKLLAETSSCQTLLLCAAALNNLSRMEITSHYSIMSNEAIFKLIESVSAKDEEMTIFFYEQIAAMLYNMSLNKRCHSHLTNGSIINFITSTYDVEFYKGYSSRAETDAQRRTIKMILHTLNRLAQDSNLGAELLQHQSLPICFKLPINPFSSNANTKDTFTEAEVAPQTPLDCRHKKQTDPLLRNASKDEDAGNTGKTSLSAGANCTTSGLKFNLTRQESYV